MAEQPWQSSESGRAFVRAEMERIERVHATYPRCRKCGRVTNPSKSGLCTRLSCTPKRPV